MYDSCYVLLLSTNVENISRIGGAIGRPSRVRIGGAGHRCRMLCKRLDHAHADSHARRYNHRISKLNI